MNGGASMVGTWSKKNSRAELNRISVKIRERWNYIHRRKNLCYQTEPHLFHQNTVKTTKKERKKKLVEKQWNIHQTILSHFTIAFILTLCFWIPWCDAVATKSAPTNLDAEQWTFLIADRIYSNLKSRTIQPVKLWHFGHFVHYFKRQSFLYLWNRSETKGNIEFYWSKPKNINILPINK